MKKEYHTLKGERTAVFCSDDRKVWLSRLYGLICGFNGRDEGQWRTRGMFHIDTNRGCLNGKTPMLQQVQQEEHRIRMAWKAQHIDLQLESHWNFCMETGVWSRRDIIINTGEEDVNLTRCLSRFCFTPGIYECYSQASGWCQENQGEWQIIKNGRWTLECEGGRTCQGSTPYLAIREKGGKAGVVFHILPQGNWTIRVATPTAGGDSSPFLVVELGWADDSLDVILQPGEVMELPEILLHNLEQGEVQNSTVALHRYLLKNFMASSKPFAPVVYNTWFDCFDFLNVDRLEDQLKAARKVGCEVFAIDAGWYGQAQGPWSSQTGDWREKLNGAFHGKMKEFSEKVRESGLGFGLWMEPERIGPQAPILKQHPEWFLATDNGNWYPKLWEAEVYNYMKGEISRLVETYNLAWMKVDFNFELSTDPTGYELLQYYKSWYQMLDEIRQDYPKLFLEGCASGGMRLDLNTSCHFDGHFLSDTVEPVDAIRIYQGALLRLLPGRVTKWAVLRETGNNIPLYGLPQDEWPVAIVTPGGATWEGSHTADIDFMFINAMMGMLGISGDLCGLPQSIQERIADLLLFYKKWRRFITGSTAYLLTPPQPKENRNGWAAFQLQQPQNMNKVLVFAFRLKDSSPCRSFPLQGLNEKEKYTVETMDGRRMTAEELTGQQLMNDGLEMSIENCFGALVAVLRKCDS
jgi:alpha-galactosidase